MYDSSNEKFTLSIAKDITMENVYHRQKVIYESLISQTPSMISIYKDFKPIYVNGSFREFSDRLLLEYNDDLRNLLINLNSEEHFDDIKNLSNNDSLAFDVQLKHGNKKYYLHVICFEILFGNDVHHAIVMNDFTKINKMNESVEQSKKLLTDLDVLASLGTMTAGLMHEINNPLGYIASKRGVFEKCISKAPNRK